MALDFKQKLLQEAAEDFKRGALDEAEKKCLNILARDAYQVATMNLLAGILCKKGRHEDALEYMKQVTNLVPTVPEFQVNCGDIFMDIGQPAAADSYYQRAIQLRPAYPRAWFQRGVALSRLKQVPEAKKCFEQVLQLDPRNVSSLLQLTAIARDEKRAEDQLALADAILKIDPANVEAHRHRAMALSLQGMISECLAEFRVCLQLAPNPFVHSTFLLNLCYDHNTSPEEVLAEHVAWAKLYAVTPTDSVLTFDRDRSGDRCLRIGYVSADFREHAVSRFLKQVIAHHDPSLVKVYAYYSRSERDEITDWYQSHVGAWRDISALSDVQTAEAIRADGIDILVDLCGHTDGHRLQMFALRPAPIQATWLAYPNTTGLSQIDYLISDPMIDPVDHPTPGSETIWRLPGAFSVFDEPAASLPVNDLPALRNGFITFGSFQTLPKLNDAVLDLWSEALHAVPTAKLLIFRSALSNRAKSELGRRFEERSIGGDRLIFEQRRPPSGNHMEMYHHIDVHLDSFPWNGHTTTCEALWMGVPTLTLRGDRHSARMSASMLSRLGLESWIAESRAEFVEKAVGIARQLDELATFASFIYVIG